MIYMTTTKQEIQDENIHQGRIEIYIYYRFGSEMLSFGGNPFAPHSYSVSYLAQILITPSEHFPEKVSYSICFLIFMVL